MTTDEILEDIRARVRDALSSPTSADLVCALVDLRELAQAMDLLDVTLSIKGDDLPSDWKRDSNT